MKIVGIREAQLHFSNVINDSQKESIVLTRHGRPVATLRGVDGQKMEDVLLKIKSKDVGRRRARTF